MSATTNAELTYRVISKLGDVADRASRIPRYGYHIAGPIHRLAVALMPAYRHWLRVAAAQTARELEN